MIKSAFQLIFIKLFLLMNILNAAPIEFVVLKSKQFSVAKDKEQYFIIEQVMWGPNWKWEVVKGETHEKGSEVELTNQTKISETDTDVSITSLLIPFDEHRLIIDNETIASKESPLTMFAYVIKPNLEFFDKGSLIVKTDDGEMKSINFPIGRNSFGTGHNVKGFILVDNDGERTEFLFDPSIKLVTDTMIKIGLVTESLSMDKIYNHKIIINFPQQFSIYSNSENSPNEWYPFQTKGNHKLKNSIDMSSWLEKPAGKHGRIKRVKDKLIYNDEEIKLWGVNLKFAHTAPKKDLADKKADYYAKYGINAVRLHQFSQGPGWQGIQSQGSVLEFEPEALDRFDYLFSKLKENGIYSALSLNFHLTLGRDDVQYVPYIDEFEKAFGTENQDLRIKTSVGSIFLSEELQNLQIQQMKKLLEHKNPYTGLTYAEDPSVIFVEAFNEDSALFYGTLKQIQQIPTLRTRAGEMFTAWLKNKYDSEEALSEAWGSRALNSFKAEGFTDESWDENTILPLGNPWYYDTKNLNTSQSFRKQRLLDTMEFLYELQNNYYSKFKEEINKTGYDGEFIASNWKAGGGISHFYNLHSDYLIGIIDRHSYTGGGGEIIKNASMLSLPGTSIFSTGFLQVIDRTFMLSEWNQVFPTEWTVEGPAIIGAYGMGLQGWDVSFMFQNKDVNQINNKFTDSWQIDRPTGIGMFPAISRQVLRGDVTESDLTIPLNVDMIEVKEGYVDFEYNMEGSNDFTFHSVDKVPNEALAVGRVSVQFTEEPTNTPAFDPNQYLKDGYYVSSTKQLKWKPGNSKMDGFITIDTGGTKAVVGFANGEVEKLGSVTIEPQSRYAAIYVTALDKNSSIDTDTNVLITAIARVRQEGMVVKDDLYLLERGGPPFIMEPVKATITLDRAKNETPTVYILDHDGVRTEETIPIVDGVIEIDTGRDKTPYYEVVWDTEK